jgi:hypothetical protein
LVNTDAGGGRVFNLFCVAGGLHRVLGVKETSEQTVAPMCLSCESPVAEEILGYLAAHPDAQDTLDGIIEWWLLEQKITVEAARVKDALARLVAERLIIKSSARGSRSLYKLNRRRLKTVLKMLDEKAR